MIVPLVAPPTQIAGSTSRHPTDVDVAFQIAIDVHTSIERVIKKHQRNRLRAEQNVAEDIKAARRRSGLKTAVEPVVDVNE